MHMRGVEPTLTDTSHIVVTIAIVICTMLAIGSGSRAFGPWFRAYSLATLVTMIVFGAWAALDGARLAANLPTPWLGLTERIDIGAYLSWVAVRRFASCGKDETPPSHVVRLDCARSPCGSRSGARDGEILLHLAPGGGAPRVCKRPSCGRRRR